MSRELHAGEFSRPWFNSDTAARYTDKPSRAAFRVWAMRKAIAPVGRGGRLLYAKADIDRALQPQFAHR